MPGIVREIADLYRFFWNMPETERVIVIYGENSNYHPYLEGIVKELINRHNQPICYVTSDPKDPILVQCDSRIRTFYFKKLFPFFMAFMKCKIFVMTLTDLNQFYLKRSIHPIHYVYIFHSLVSTHMIYRHGAFDHYDSILCCGSHQVREIKRYEELYQSSQKYLIETGYYRLERIYESYQKHLATRSTSSQKRTVLLAPSWGPARVLNTIGIGIVQVLLDGGYRVVVRPHPEEIKRTRGLLSLYSSKFGGNPDVMIEDSVATDDTLLLADVLISDYSGIALEYAFGTERPVLFLDVQKKIRNERYEELGMEPLELRLRSEIGLVVSPEELSSIPNLVSRLIQDKELYKQKLAKLREQTVFDFGNSSKKGAQYIMGLVRSH